MDNTEKKTKWEEAGKESSYKESIPFILPPEGVRNFHDICARNANRISLNGNLCIYCRFGQQKGQRDGKIGEGSEAAPGRVLKGYMELKWHSQVLYCSLCVPSETNEMHFRELLLLLLLPQEPGRLVKVSTLSLSCIVRALFYDLSWIIVVDFSAQFADKFDFRLTELNELCDSFIGALSMRPSPAPSSTPAESPWSSSLTL